MSYYAVFDKDTNDSYLSSGRNSTSLEELEIPVMAFLLDGEDLDDLNPTLKEALLIFDYEIRKYKDPMPLEVDMIEMDFEKVELYTCPFCKKACEIDTTTLTEYASGVRTVAHRSCFRKAGSPPCISGCCISIKTM